MFGNSGICVLELQHLTLLIALVVLSYSIAKVCDPSVTQSYHLVGQTQHLSRKKNTKPATVLHQPSNKFAAIPAELHRLPRIHPVYPSTVYFSYLVPLTLEEMHRLCACISISIN